MVVKIRFGRGPCVTRRKGKNSRIATLAASCSRWSRSVALAGLLAGWHGSGLAGDFVFPDGFLSHWQVWIGAAVVMQYAALAA